AGDDVPPARPVRLRTPISTPSPGMLLLDAMKKPTLNGPAVDAALRTVLATAIVPPGATDAGTVSAGISRAAPMTSVAGAVRVLLVSSASVTWFRLSARAER